MNGQTTASPEVPSLAQMATSHRGAGSHASGRQLSTSSTAKLGSTAWSARVRSGSRRTKGPDGSPSRCKTMLLDLLELSHFTETATRRPSNVPGDELKTPRLVLGEGGSECDEVGVSAESRMLAGLPRLPIASASLSRFLTFVKTRLLLADTPPRCGAFSM